MTARFEAKCKHPRPCACGSGLIRRVSTATTSTGWRLSSFILVIRPSGERREANSFFFFFPLWHINFSLTSAQNSKRSGHYFSCIRQDLSSAADLSVRGHLKDSAVFGSSSGAPADVELSTSGSSSSPPSREVQCAPLPARYQQAYMHLDDSSVQYFSLAELQGLLSRTSQKPSTAYILFYERVEAEAAA
jgi:hypothetical protein